MNVELHKWPEATARKYEGKGYWKAITLGEHLRTWAKEYGDRIGIVDGGTRLSYSELDRQVDIFASGLDQLGIKANDKVIIQLPNGKEFIIACFALFRLSAIPIFTMMANRETEMTAFCQLAMPVAYITTKSFLGFDHLALCRKIAENNTCLKNLIVDGDLCKDDNHENGSQTYRIYSFHSISAPEKQFDNPDYKNTALLLLSGGTTGIPKLIPRTHADYGYNVHASTRRCGFHSDSVYLAVLPIAHNFPFGCPGILGTMSVGGRVVLAKTSSCDETFPLIEQEKVTVTSLVPPLVTMWLQVSEWDDSDLSSLALLQVGGAYFDPELAAKVEPTLGCRLQQVYGMAEGLLCYTSNEDSEEDILTTQGKPLSDDDEIKVVDRDGKNVDVGSTGELLVRGPYTIRGYFKADEHNKSAFTEEGYYRSGDLVRITPSGNIQVTGRVKDQINRAGEKIAAAEVESHLRAHPEIQDAALVALPDELLGERSCAFIISSNVDINLQIIHHFLHERGLSQYKKPDQIEVVDQWPLTNVGKIDKRKLVALASTKGN